MFVKISLHRASCFVHNNLQTKDIYNLYVSKLECWISMQSEIIWACIHIFLLVFVYILFCNIIRNKKKQQCPRKHYVFVWLGFFIIYWPLIRHYNPVKRRQPNLPLEFLYDILSMSWFFPLRCLYDILSMSTF